MGFNTQKILLVTIYDIFSVFVTIIQKVSMLMTNTKIQYTQQHSLSVPSKLGKARVETHQEPQVTVQPLQYLLSKQSYSNIDL